MRLFDKPAGQLVRDASEQAIVKFIEERLNSIFPHVAKGLVLRNFKEQSLVSFVFLRIQPQGRNGKLG